MRGPRDVAQTAPVVQKVEVGQDEELADLEDAKLQARNGKHRAKIAVGERRSEQVDKPRYRARRAQNRRAVEEHVAQARAEGR
ncbi:serine/threonine-protein phosphatase [Babesia caballi]|uniref:Serine/threonine-protein phosphatase n=1 Tax=Babesia caballi TaxID=5871 RepID=A0AAV4LVC9_BABCB|nr:serine/threonine-protein phosphatase [Babesia caballi]